MAARLKAGQPRAPSFLIQRQVQRLDSFLRRLLGGKTGPFMSAVFLGGPGLFQIPFCLG